MKLLILALILLSNPIVASKIEGKIGANYTNYEIAEETLAGASAILKYNNFQGGGKGYFAHGLFRGESILNVDAILGYAMKTGGSSFFEIGGGLALNPFFGYGPGFLFGLGTDLGSGWHVNLSTVYFGGGLTYIMITPMLGTKF